MIIKLMQFMTFIFSFVHIWSTRRQEYFSLLCLVELES